MFLCSTVICWSKHVIKFNDKKDQWSHNNIEIVHIYGYKYILKDILSGKWPYNLKEIFTERMWRILLHLRWDEESCCTFNFTYLQHWSTFHTKIWYRCKNKKVYHIKYYKNLWKSIIPCRGTNVRWDDFLSNICSSE